MLKFIRVILLVIFVSGLTATAPALAKFNKRHIAENDTRALGGLQGFIHDASDEAIAFAAVYVTELQKGTTANEKGAYQLRLPPGKWEVRFQYLGMKTRVVQVEINHDFIDLDIIMEPQSLSLPVFTLRADAEDPAMYIMRRAIGMSPYYLNQVSAYKARVYMRGSGVLTSIPRIMQRQLSQDGVKEDQYFVTETISEIDFQAPDQVQTRVISTRSSGNDSQTSPMMFVTMSLYRDINGIISPLSRSAFQVYDFKLEGSFQENGHHINKIRVIPKRSGPDLYSGHIYIRENSWNLHTVDLRIEQNLFSAEIRQVYNEVDQGVWMPVSQNFFFKVGIMGLEIEYTYLVSVSDYEIRLNPHIDHQINERQQIAGLINQENLDRSGARRLNRMISRETSSSIPRRSLEVGGQQTEVEDSARIRSRDYWEQHRPVPLSSKERESFEEDDSPDEETDSLQTQKKFRPEHLNKILQGSSYRLSDSWRFTYGGLLSVSGLEYNTVDGMLFSQQIGFRYRAPADRELNFRGNLAYGFASKNLYGEAGLVWRYQPWRRARLEISAGRLGTDFNRDGGMHPRLNTLSSLYLSRNDRKIFDRSFVQAENRIDLANGLVLGTRIEYARRSPLENNTAYYMTNLFGDRFTPNIPGIAGHETQPMPEHSAFLAGLSLQYTPRHYYRRMGQRKVMLYSAFPTFGISYTEGLKGLFNTGAGFRLLEASIDHSFDLRLIGSFRYRLQAGQFLNSDSLFTPDYRHFKGNTTWIMADASHDRFRMLDFYSHSTPDKYALMHLQYSHGRILLKRLPWLSGSLIRENIFVNSLFTPDKKAHWEIGYGLSQVFLLFQIEVVSSFSGSHHHMSGIRLGIPINSGQVGLRL